MSPGAAYEYPQTHAIYFGGVCIRRRKEWGDLKQKREDLTCAIATKSTPSHLLSAPGSSPHILPHCRLGSTNSSTDSRHTQLDHWIGLLCIESKAAGHQDPCIQNHVNDVWCSQAQPTQSLPGMPSWERITLVG